MVNNQSINSVELPSFVKQQYALGLFQSNKEGHNCKTSLPASNAKHSSKNKQWTRPSPNKSKRLLLSSKDVMKSHTIQQAYPSGCNPPQVKRINQFIARELEILGESGNTSTQSRVSAARLQVYREAFHQLLESLPAYKPLLSSIKHQYEAFVEQNTQKLQRIPMLEAQVMELNAEKRQLDKDLTTTFRREKKMLSDRIDLIRSKEEQLSKELHLIKADREKIRVEKINIEKNYMEMRQSNVHLVAALKRHDVEKLRNEIQASNFQRDEISARSELEKLRSDYESLIIEVSRLRALEKDASNSEHVKLFKEKIDSLSLELKELRTNYRILSDEHANMQTTYKEAAHIRERLEADQDEMDRLRETATPRPDWNEVFEDAELPKKEVQGRSSESLAYYLVDYISKLQNQLKKAGKGKIASKEETVKQNVHQEENSKLPTAIANTLDEAMVSLMDTIRDIDSSSSSSEEEESDGESAVDESEEGQLLRDLFEKGSLSTETDSFILAKGMGEEVPVYLRMNGKVRNLRLSKRETERLIKDCWMRKEKERNAESLENYFHTYLKRRFRSHGDVVEWGYNIVRALELYSYDSDCELFLKILHGELGEHAHWEQVQMLHRFREALAAYDKNVNQGQPRNSIPRQELLRIVREQFPTKPETNFSVLQQALFFEAPGAMVQYVKLFEEDRDGNQGKFVEALRDQYLEEIQQYVAEIEEQIHDAAKGSDDGKLSISELRDAILQVDVQKPAKELETYLSRGCQLPIEHVAESLKRESKYDDEHLRTTPQEFIKHLKSGLVKRTALPVQR